MFLFRLLLLIPTATTFLILLQMTTTTSAFLSPVPNSNRKQLEPHKYDSHPSFPPSCGQLSPSITSLNLISSSTVSVITTTTTAIIAELLDTTADSEVILSPPPLLPTITAVEGLSPTTNTIVFVLGLVPFVWATYEFWSRIAVGASFGTGADSIQIRPGGSTGDNGSVGGGTSIGEDGNPSKSRGRKVLGDDALVVAYVLFAVAIGSVGIAVYSVVSSPLPPM